MKKKRKRNLASSASRVACPAPRREEFVPALRVG